MGVTTNLTTPAIVPVLVSTVFILPVPGVVNPVTVPTVFEAVQENVVAATLDVRDMAVLLPEQIVLLIGLLETSGLGKTVIT